MKYFIKTFGCQMNVSDSERIAAFLEQHNFSVTDNIKEADLTIFNTCGIKQTAENRAYSMINNLRKKHKTWNIEHGTKQENAKSKVIVMTGCLANRADVQKRMKSKVDLFFPVKDIREFENWIIENYLEIGNWKLEIAAPNKITNKENIAYLSINPKYSSNYAAYVPIMTGCNNFCSYCVVPNARGREVSRPAEEIIKEIKDLVAKGYKSITLLGQNVNSYKSPTTINYQLSTKNTQKEINFSKLLKKINSIPGKFWISFVSSHPKDMTDELIETVARCKKVCEWIHLPVQAGDDEILRRMNRKYTQKHYLEQIKKIRKAFVKIRGKSVLISVSSDIIVGFPGETKKQFLESAAVMKKSKFDMVFFGQYSPRPETVAWKMKDNVSQKEKARRENYLNEILKKTAFANNKKYVGKTFEVLIERVKSTAADNASRKSFICFGKTRTQKNVKIVSNKKIQIGTFVKVKIIKANIWNLEGRAE
ncbi:MAG TPA: tRNA (N6-isopentenyl adenosine(37)-C2)-methylthiotransferase MiaB [Candidatus Moranbacteria bacterium]|nr:tRNA (N6-isopentenyl adenosine(37)-C2)-methylthiotransferase MiaB [Candidatus Moranbacteria bacterium]HBT45532.1 tRNA (N6-isopentenyl adenosine(37)-C2)-methylthiotransferase MiaB [Candidatus Moranbacteria bacterium]